MTNKPSYSNPLHLIKLSVSEFVWRWYDTQMKEQFKILNLNDESSYHTLSTTWRNYFNGNRQARFSNFNLHLKDAIERVLPIANSSAFFTGDEFEQQNEALDTANRMIEAFEAEHKRQIEENELKVVA